MRQIAAQLVISGDSAGGMINEKQCESMKGMKSSKGTIKIAFTCCFIVV
jgi:hypothetical protein